MLEFISRAALMPTRPSSARRGAGGINPALRWWVLFALLLASAIPQAIHAEAAAAATEAVAPTNTDTPSDNFDFFSDQPVAASEIVLLPPEKPAWSTIGGPIALALFFFALNLVIWWLVPFSSHSIDINLRNFPPAAKRGIAMAVVIFGIAFVFGASEISYQLKLHGSASAYFEQMSLGKLIAFSHAHLFGFTTSFFIVGIPFSLQFNQLRVYQWVFPVGLAASLTDVMSWWGIKYVSANFEWISLFCGLLFTVSYLWMLIGLLRVLLFPEVIWGSDKDKEQRLAQRREQEQQQQQQQGRR